MNLKYIHFNDFKPTTADTVVIFFTLALVEGRNPSNLNNIRESYKLFKEGISSRAGYFPIVPGYFLSQNPKCFSS